MLNEHTFALTVVLAGMFEENWLVESYLRGHPTLNNQSQAEARHFSSH